MRFFGWDKKEEGEGRLSRFWKKVKNALTGKSSSPEEVKKEIEHHFSEAVIDVVNKMFIPLVQQNIVDGDHRFTNYPSGHAINNIYATADGKGKVTVGIRDAPYFGRVEFGTDPRSVDSAEFIRLMDWVVAKDTKGIVRDPFAVAQAVQRKIETKGNTEYAPFSDALDAVSDDMNKEILKEVTWRFD